MAGYCFAGNAAFLGCCDIVIAVEDSNLGMGGPAMIEGGGLGMSTAQLESWANICFQVRVNAIACACVCVCC